jgi:hypothetical protein
MDGCKDADPKHIPEYVEDRMRRRRPFAAPTLPAEFPNRLREKSAFVTSYNPSYLIQICTYK